MYFIEVNKSVKNHHIYSGNFVLNVIDLSQINLATEEDKKYHIDKWAKFFKAATWEEVRKMAEQNEYLQEAARSIFHFSADDQIRKMCRDRIEYHQDLRNYERFIEKQADIIAQKDEMLKNALATIAALQAQLEKK